AVHVERVAQRVPDPHARVERGRGVLEDDGHDAADPAAHVGRVLRHRRAAEADLALRRRLEADEHLRHGRLARAGLADDAERAAAPHLDADVVHRVHAVRAEQRARAGREDDVHVPQLDDGRLAVVRGAVPGALGRVGGAHRAPPVVIGAVPAPTGSAGGIATRCWPSSSTARRTGRTSSPRSGCDERGANRSPVGKSRGDGTVPGIWCSRVERCSIDSTAPSRPCVYSWRGSASSSPVGACSTTWPAYMTVMRCAISATSARSWLTKTIANPSFSRSSSSSATTWAWTVTSRAVVGSSAMMSFGSRVSAMAMSTRWRWPPESSCG